MFDIINRRNYLNYLTINEMEIEMKLSMIIFLTILTAMAQADSWNCRNDLEITCDSKKCEAQIEDGFTPMDVSVDNNSGSMSVCAYTGCWEGIGKVLKSENFTIITAHHLKFSTAQDSEGIDIVIVIDRHDNIGIIKAGAFAQPLICKAKS